MDWLRSNGFWVLIFVVFIGVHIFGHGGHGGHGGDESRRPPRERDGDEPPRRPSGHQH